MKNYKIEEIRNPKFSEIKKSVLYKTWSYSYANIFSQSLIDELFHGNVVERRSWKAVEERNVVNKVAFISNVPVGILSANYSFNNVCEVTSLYVVPEFQGCGIGSHLWDSIFERMETGNAFLVLTWLMEAARSKEFYVKKGCHCISSGDYYIGEQRETALLYAKIITMPNKTLHTDGNSAALHCRR